MKHLTHIILLSVVLSLFGCSDRRATSVLNHADSLLSTHPDTVLVMLDSLRAERSSDMSRRQKMRLELLRADAQNKAFVNFTTDSVMREVTAYYDAHGTAQERMRAHYLLGCTYRDMGDAPRALECFHDAVSCADTTSADCDFQRLSRIYGQMADLFHAQRSPQFEKEAELNAIRMAWKAKDTLAALNFYAHLSNVYRLDFKNDSAFIILKEVCDKYNEFGYPKLSAGFQGMLAEIYLQRKKMYAEAKRAMDGFEKYYYKNDSVASGREFYYYYKGVYYSRINSDSALYFYYKLLNKAHNIGHYENAYKGLLHMYHKLGKPDSVMKYAQMFADANDSACLISSAEEINRANAIYNYNASRRQAKIKEQEAKQYRNAAILICLIVAISTIAIVTYIVKQKKRIKQVEATYEKTLSRYRKTACDLQLLKKDMNKYIKSKESELNELRISLSILSSNENPTGKWDDSQTFLESPIILHLNELAAKGKKMSDAELNDFIVAMEKHTPTFYERLTNNTPELTQQELHVCLLSKMSYTSSMIGALLALTKQRVTNIRGNANQKLFGESGAGSLNKNMQNL